MSDPRPPVPGERRLARPPSERYAEAEQRATSDRPSRTVSPTRGVVAAAIVAALGAVAITLLGGVLAVTLGLVVVAGITGWTAAIALRFGAGGTIEGPRRALLGACITAVGVLAGQLGLWLYAGSEGGVLPLVDYLAEVFGLLVPLQVVVATVIAWATAR